MLNSLPEINLASLNPSQFIKNAEKGYLKEVYDAAKRIADNDSIKIVALAGPSASGKTTTAHILCKRLEVIGEKPIVVSLDDFYLPPEKLPALPDGRLDYESVNSLNLELLKKCFNEIVKFGKTVLPKYDFTVKKSIENHTPIDITDGGILIVEGLHALNPIITDLVPRENIFKTYISVNCSITDSFGEQLLSSRQIRLVRRTLRDRIFRDSSVEKTLSLWNGVVEGERKYLYCYKNTADAQIRTLHHYEPCVYRDEFVKLRSEITKDTVCYEYFMRTVNAIEKFKSLPMSVVPEKSLIREFIGNDIK